MTKSDHLKVTRASQINHFDGWYIEDEQGESYISHEAYVTAAQLLPLSRLWRWTLRWRWVRRTLWGLLSYRVSRLPTITGAPCIVREPHPFPYQQLLVRTGLTAVLLPLFLMVVQWNLADLEFNDEPMAPPLTGEARGAVLLTGLYQGWGMFRRSRQTPNGWVRVAAVFEDDSVLELSTASDLHTNIIHWRYGPFGRMRKYNENVREGDNEPLLEAMARHYCDHYNNHMALPPGERLATMEIQYFRRYFVAYNQPREDYEPQLLWKHWCFAEYRY